MALSGACPGTVLAQTALGIRSGYYALDGAVLAGIIWSGLLRPYFGKRRDQEVEKGQLTIQESLGAKQVAVLAGFEALCVAIVGGTLLVASPSTGVKIHPVLGGVLLGFAQLVSVLATKSLVGVSGSYEEAGDGFWWLLKGANGPVPSTTAMHFALGIDGGAWAVASYRPSVVQGPSLDVPLSLAMLGGFTMVMGSRIAGGCTSGHGISGISSFSISSLITIGAMFIGGAIVARFLPF